MVKADCGFLLTVLGGFVVAVGCCDEAEWWVVVWLVGVVEKLCEGVVLRSNEGAEGVEIKRYLDWLRDSSSVGL